MNGAKAKLFLQTMIRHFVQLIRYLLKHPYTRQNLLLVLYVV